jgi:ABC-type transport system involved in multi-copper enzyme maturation permease subunit
LLLCSSAVGPRRPSGSQATLPLNVALAKELPAKLSVTSKLPSLRARGAVMGAPLPLGESLIIAWPQTVALIAGTIVLFVAGYVVFQRQEVRA